MGDEEPRTVGDYVFPAGLEPDEGLTYRIPFGDEEVEDLKWEGYTDVAHQAGVQSIETEVVDSGEYDGLLYAAVKARVVAEDGGVFESLQAADTATNQVREPTFVWAVAESRALKRAVKKALNIKPVSAHASDEPAPTGDVERGPEKPDDVEFEDGHALSDNYQDPEDSGSTASVGAADEEGW